MIDVYNKATNELLGSITEADLQVLVDALEEESSDDQDYYIDAATIDVIGDGRATDHLLLVLRKALGNAESVDIRWKPRARKDRYFAAGAVLRYRSSHSIVSRSTSGNC